MEFEGSQLNINELGSSGIVLSVEQEASLQTSLVILARDHKFRKVKLWGVVKGVQKDYFVAQGVGRDELKDRKFVYRYLTIQILISDILSNSFLLPQVKIYFSGICSHTWMMA